MFYSLCGNVALTRFHAVVPASVPSAGEDKWVVIVDRASLLLIQALSGLYKVQEQCWRLLELHSIKIVSSGIIWVSLQEVGIPGTPLQILWGLFSFSHHVNILYICGGVSIFFQPIKNM